MKLETWGSQLSFKSWTVGSGEFLPDLKVQVSSKATKGRILRVKYGYNPNSSSIGSIVYVFSAKILGAAVGFGVVASLICSAFLGRPRGSAERSDSEPDKKDTEK